MLLEHRPFSLPLPDGPNLKIARGRVCFGLFGDSEGLFNPKPFFHWGRAQSSLPEATHCLRRVGRR
jgi:hypothetical protein